MGKNKKEENQRIKMDTFPHSDNPYLQPAITATDVEALDHFDDTIRAFESTIEEEFLTI